MSTILETGTRDVHLAKTVKASSAVTATGTGDAVRLTDAPNGYSFVLDVTATATAVDDTLNVYIQTMIDGVNWVDVVAFTQVLGNGNAKRHIAKLSSDAALTMFENGAALTAGSIRNLCGDQWRARWVVVDADTANASFTFSVTACPM
jgi:hypothetical protein